MNRPDLDQKALAAGIPDPSVYKTKGELTAAIQAAEEPQVASGGLPPCIIVVPEQTDEGLTINVTANGFTLLETPTLLALAKKQVEEKLGI